MSLLNDASLVFIPSGYKEDKVYSVIPSNGAGDLDFVRGCDATRINPQALVENTPWNIAQYSEDFSNAAWSKSNVTITSDTTIAPNGTNTADLIYPSSSGNYRYAFEVFTQTNNIYTLSVYAKAQNKNVIWLYIESSAGFGIVYYDLSDGTIQINAGSTSTPNASIENIGNGWYRCSFTLGSSTDLSAGSGFGVCDAKGSPYVTASGTNGVYFWGAQLNIGSTAKPYFPTTDRLNVPRLTYSPTLIERQSTNKWYYSEQIDNAEWLKTECTITSNAITSPDGTQNAEKITDTTANNEHRFRATSSLFTITTETTFSIFAKAGEYSKFGIADLSNGYIVKFDLSAGTIISTGTDWSNAKIENFGNGWYRLSATRTTNATCGYAMLNDLGDFVFTGTGTKGVYIWGAQAETGSLTSYIPTTSTAVTRVASYNSGCPSLLLEKQSTNLFLYSEQLDNVNWLKSGVSLNVNTSISPDGTQNADNVIYGSGGGAIEQLIYYSAGNLTHTVSCYVKCNSGTQDFQLKLTHAGVANYYSPTYTATTQWQRFTFTQAFGAGGIGFYAGVISANTTLNIWGLQLEPNSSYVTSYIPTTSATVTRLADSCSKTGISSLIGQTSGTIFIDVNLTHSNGSGGNQYFIQLYQDTSNRILIYRDSTNKLSFYVLVGGGNFNFQSSVTSGGRHKIGFAYQSGNSAFYIDGTQIVLDTTAFSSFSSMSALHLGANLITTIDEIGDYEYNQTLLFKRRLTNTELANLTTL